MKQLVTQFKQLFLRRNTILKKWLLSYLIILIIPLVGSLCTYFITYQMIRQEVVRANSVALKTMQTAVDYRLQQARELCSSLILDKRFQEFLLKINTPQDIVQKQTDLVTLLNNYCSTTSATNILVYVPELDYCVTNNTANTLLRLYDALYFTDKIQLPIEAWRSSLTDFDDNRRYMYSPLFSYQKFGDDSIVYFTTSNIGLWQNSYKANIFISVQLDELQKLVSAYQNSSVLILDYQGKVIKTYGDKIGDFVLPPELLRKKDAYEIIKAGNKKYVCSYISSTTGSFVYAVTTPYHLFWSRSYYFTTISVVGFICVSFAGVCIALYLLYRNYTPLQNTLRLLRNRKDADAEKKNEFEVLSEQIESLYHNQEAMQTNISKQRNLLKEGYLLSLLEGSNWNLPNNDMLEVLRSDCEGKTLVPVCIYMENGHQFFLTSPSAKAKGVSVPFLIENVWTEMFSASTSYMKTCTDTNVTYIYMLTPEQLDGFDDELFPLLEKLCLFFKKELSLSLHAVIGTHIEDLEHLSDIYKGISLAHTRQLQTAGHLVVRAADFAEIPTAAELRLDTFAQPLCKAVQHMAYQDAISLAEGLFDELSRLEQPLTSTRFYLFSLVERLQAAFLATGGKDAPEKTVSLFSLMDSFSEAKSFPVLKRVFCDILTLLCFHNQKAYAKAEDNLYVRIEHYIAEHYADANLSLAQIADYIGLGAKYISKLFKMETGQGLPDYINTVRIGKAKEILLQAEPTISELARLVGFSNVKTFRRAFQKLERMNPRDYGPVHKFEL